MIAISGLAAVRSEGEGVESSSLPEFVQDVEVGVDVEGVVDVRWISVCSPLVRERHLQPDSPLVLGFVVHRIKSDHLDFFVIRQAELTDRLV